MKAFYYDWFYSDWRMPKASHSLNSPYDESRKYAKYESESFKEDLQKHLNKVTFL